MNLASMIEQHPDGDLALVGHRGTWTYERLRADVAVARASLRRAGVREGDHVGIVCENDPGVVAAYLGVLGVGAVAVPLNPEAPVPALEQELSSADVAGLVVPEGTAAAFTGSGDWSGRVLRLGREGGDVTVEGVRDRSGDPGLVDRAPDDLAVLIFTSGTAGAPKPACLTHANMASNREQIQRHEALAVERTDVVLGALPIWHVFGLGVVLGSALGAGAALVLLESFRAGAALDTVRENRVTLLPGVPTMLAALALAPGAERQDLASVRRVVSGAAPLTEEVSSKFESVFGLPVWQGYGLTEASPLVTSSLVGGRAKPGSIGVPVSGVEVRLVDAEGSDSLVGDPGEIWVRGPNVFAGYWKDDAATSRVLTREGWLRTGDVAVMDEDGDLFLVDRAKDLVIVSGFNVYPAEVEEVLGAHPSVADVAVVGVDSAATGQSVKAFVKVEPGAEADESAMVEHCARYLARYKCPKEIVFVDDIPRGVAGKLLRENLP